jgi:hypothetical protein
MTTTPTYVVIAPHLRARLAVRGFGPAIQEDPRYPGALFIVNHGYCVADGKPMSKNHDAHAHGHPVSPWYGMVCVRTQADFDNPVLRSHEVAHIANKKKDAHGHEWRKVMRSFEPGPAGEKEARRYRTKRRKSVLVTSGGTTTWVIAPVEATHSRVLKDGTVEVSPALHDMLVDAAFVAAGEPYTVQVKKRGS